jgi:uncharacterized integral membrane protein (TIGR00697 family)
VIKKSPLPVHVYELLIALYVTTLIVSNIASVKLVGLSNVVFDAGTILFPLAYILSDIITEVYGFRKMRSILMIGIGMLLLTSLTFWIVGILPAAVDWANQGAYDSILGVVWRIVAASVIAIFLGELLNAYVLAKMKVKTKGKKLWSRLIGSSAVGSLVDTVTFSVIAFAGTIPAATLLSIILTVYVIKMATEIVVSPLTMRIIASIKRLENIDSFEEPVLFRRRG